MEINLSLSGENVGVIDPIMDDSYNKNGSLTLDADFTLMLRRGAHRLATVLEREAAQACI